MTTERVYTLQALTDIWTGDAAGKPGRLIPTGLLGSIRWWFEVLVRGLGGSACDPSHRKDNKPGPCPEPGRKPHDAGHHCVVCELFGCTGWARKFRFDVWDENDRPKQTQIKKGETFKLSFTELRPICEKEWALLDLTLRLIAACGAIGGKTVYKPTEETSRQLEQHHQDLGLVKLVSSTQGGQFQEDELRRYVSLPEWRKLKLGDFAWASLQHFWCVPGRYLSRKDVDRSSFNQVLGRPESKRCRDCGKVHHPRQKCQKTKKHPRRCSDENPRRAPDKWLAGQQQVSKKVLSFKSPPRTFGFVNGDTVTFDEIKKRLRSVWPDLNDAKFRSGPQILRELLKEVNGL